MKNLNIFESNDYSEKGFTNFLVHESPYFKIINFNFKAGQSLPIHSHEIEGELSILVLEGEGFFLGKDEKTLSAKKGEMLVCDIAAPHGIRADTDMRVLVTIAPPI
ncbi:Cupin 2 conserved barrel domain protein [Desulfatibacillum aliphaticivorans]|uniref:Cupin 2 conserved barrel domain protein n=1 Tax=Desulfatibacillum aliphaticivorans TaxID=218208 RepID=B8FC48_DESAL|nr:cupin domain-containing protein [Desulfatibacillum aliphaticivorans]ACL05253.1 Cupin 2 conserved barrel domain protein [Desulfatibacillum aliphaticivorans]